MAPAVSATYTGTGAATVATLAKGATQHTGAGNSKGMAALCVVYYLANSTGPNVTATGYLKGTQAFWQYLAWYTAACGGAVYTGTASQNGAPYRNNATAPALGNAAGTSLSRLAQHAVWQLRKGLQNRAAQAAQQAAVAAGTQVA